MRPVHTAVHMQDSVWHTVTDVLACSDALQDILQSASCDTLYFASCLLLAWCGTASCQIKRRTQYKAAMLSAKTALRCHFHFIGPDNYLSLQIDARKAAHSVGWATSAYVFFCAHGSLQDAPKMHRNAEPGK